MTCHSINKIYATIEFIFQLNINRFLFKIPYNLVLKYNLVYYIFYLSYYSQKNKLIKIINPIYDKSLWNIFPFLDLKL